MKHLSIIFLLILSGIACASVEFRQFANPEQQEAYETLTSELRCLVCQNQTIADSNAELAADLRRQVYEMLQQGKSKQDIAQFMTDRYGDFVLYNPPFKLKTGLLWMGPVVFLLIGLIAVFLFARRKKTASVLHSSTGNENAEKLAKIRNLLEKGDQS
ncbi:cytochrome c-type biogenesis protein CcmH [Methylobacter tundripaludum]|uniref:Cytochrome c-type biogenesis protein n=1 Tax=Methylobacter tundripaludum TaxID=173365 RepID=A0A2S6HJS0_9GAMM|nr:cytochrome c-type biogenesis protein [Methylobacter tundripaludum]PPK77725.1 cytochrome c-type biogenesis protein CcmH [Methylobacter tundripaludum]